MCSNIKPDEDLPELSPAAKRRPGFTNCAPGCGGWPCSCWYYDPACLFYRYFAEPTSNDIYELFHCPIWSTRLRLKVELGALKLTLDVAPGIKYSIVDSNISITAVGIHTPPLQAHSATFISAYGLGAKIARWTSFTFTPTSSPGAPAKEFAGELQCKDKQSAEDFNCVFDPTLCKCVGFATKVNCRCFHEKMTEYRKNHKLPTRGINHQVLMINNRVTTLTVQETMVCCDYSIVVTIFSQGSTKDLSVESSAVVIVPRTTVAPGVTNKVSVIPFRPLHFTAPPKNGPPGVSPPPAPGGQCGVAPDFTPCVSNEITIKSLLECCKRKNLPAGCQQLCRYDITQAEIRAAMDRGQCGIFNVAPFLECASQGKDNSECCNCSEDWPPM
ncbi:hypothetical protein CRE_10715 [Caenorhabditis remanei]|uniref:Phlebovirus glycoprotein G2 fusion domain-containing protein n=1 Tax=Caenorhabditis remanei TaxID=31234 RepID=E3NML0_CAERE|nr:hypothetical protein CRE_10715 [Caenorhabditis remanei]